MECYALSILVLHHVIASNICINRRKAQDAKPQPQALTISKYRLNMPLVKIDMIKKVRTADEIKKLADVVQEVMLEKFNAPPRDRCIFSLLSQKQKPLFA